MLARGGKSLELKEGRVKAPYDKGLSQAQVDAQRELNGTNFVRHGVGKSYGAIVLDNVLTVFNLIGLLVFILMLAVKSYSNIFFYVVILANTLIGVVLEVRAKLSVQKLSIMTSPKAAVMRGGEKTEIAVGDIVLDDVLYLYAGKQIPADSKVIEGYVECNEALLTGESLPVKKNKGEMLLSGSFVVSGSCYARVEHIREANYVENLTRQAKKFAKPKSRLMKSISRIINVIAVIVPILGIATYFNSFGFYGNAQDTIIKTSGAVIGLIPSGMVLLTSVTLAVSVLKMARVNLLVQDLYSIEMLARVNCLCLDKTGTITDGTMTVEEIIPLEKNFNLTEGVVASLLEATKDGNDTAKALKARFNAAKPRKCINCLPFSSERKFSVGEIEGFGIAVLGAAEFVVKSPDGALKETISRYTKKGMRTLLLAKAEGSLENFSKVMPLSLIVLSDTIRGDAKDIIGWFAKNDVEIKVISGDNAEAVSVIAQRVGVKNAEKYLSLEELSDEEIIERAKDFTVFGRVNPRQKALLVEALKKSGKTVAMTGDGVNDILAMKKADCSVAMASGSEAAKSVAHIVLTDNKFSSLPKVVAEGRQVVNNIQNSSALFLMKTTMTLCTVLFTLIIGAVYPFEPKHLYGIEFFVIGIPAFFLALKKNTQLIKGDFLKNTLYSTLPKGVALALAVILTYVFAGVLGIKENADAITSISMLAMTYAGVAGLFALCYPFNTINLSVAAGSFLASTGFFLAANKLMSLLGEPMLILNINPITLIYLLCSLALSLLIIISGNFIAGKIKNKKEKSNETN